MTTLDVRRFRDGDGPRVRELNEAALRSAGDYIDDVPEPDLDDVPGHYLDRNGEFLVGRHGDELVATGAYHHVDEWSLAERFDFDRRTAELTRVRVDPDHQRRGFGRALYQELEYRARGDGYHQIVLDTGAGNAAARSFYESLGFRFIGEERFHGFGETFDLAVYRKSLIG
ncbi:L-amino acid N-acyltransferase YncA [Halomicrobium zhouii]|uniref:L-amino acid N-acyltransferase YncA n=1 Tax=Halomicrobium zhouii TaxID=767519 RepID=A0A1I6LJ24_9EURY|nr:GNAT family N-acetyltransferase [Halomicrobium zhouii]SFS03439.1 L-amino acid N-acyltransferase YncA [Halomicrobium zhouii]